MNIERKTLFKTVSIANNGDSMPERSNNTAWFYNSMVAGGRFELPNVVYKRNEW